MAFAFQRDIAFASNAFLDPSQHLVVGRDDLPDLVAALYAYRIGRGPPGIVGRTARTRVQPEERPEKQHLQHGQGSDRHRGTHQGDDTGDAKQGRHAVAADRACIEASGDEHGTPANGPLPGCVELLAVAIRRHGNRRASRSERVSGSRVGRRIPGAREQVPVGAADVYGAPPAPVESSGDCGYACVVRVRPGVRQLGIEFHAPLPRQPLKRVCLAAQRRRHLDRHLGYEHDGEDAHRDSPADAAPDRAGQRTSGRREDARRRGGLLPFGGQWRWDCHGLATGIFPFRRRRGTILTAAMHPPAWGHLRAAQPVPAPAARCVRRAAQTVPVNSPRAG